MTDSLPNRVTVKDRFYCVALDVLQHKMDIKENLASDLDVQNVLNDVYM